MSRDEVFLQEEIRQWFSKIKKMNPLVQCITNRVTINDCANALLAVGASPVMADGNDAGEMAELADALVLNIGSLRADDERAIEAAAQVAMRRGIPIVIDPVGAGATRARSNYVKSLLEKFPIQIIRGNWSEIQAIGSGEGGTRGVDSAQSAKPSAELLKEWAGELGVVLAVTGKEDWVTDGRRFLAICNGDQRLQQITGTGCMSTALCGAVGAVSEDSFFGAALGVLLLSLSGELAGRTLGDCEGSGTLRIRLMDELSLMNEETLVQEGRLRYEF